MSDAAFLEFLNAVDAGIVSARKMLAQKHGISGIIDADQVTPDFEKLIWEDKEGAKGKYQQTSKRANDNSTIFQDLQRKLTESKGFWKSAGYNYWLHQNDPEVIDRRRI